jgi:signal transduction histidine kinase
LTMVRQSHPDLIITDIKMPNMDGYEFVDRLRKEEGGHSTPVIFYTASYHAREARGAAESYQVADIITKPSDPEDILKKVNAALGRGLLPQHQAKGIAAEERHELEVLQVAGLRLSALVELGMELGLERDAGRLLKRFCSTARHIIGARKSMLGIVADDGHWLKHFFVNGFKGASPIIHDRPPVHHPVLEGIIRDKKPVRINHALAELRLDQLSSHNPEIHTFLGVPLMSTIGVYGWLVLLEKQNNGHFSEADERMAITLAAQATIAYENVLFSELLLRNAEELDRSRREEIEVKDQFLSHVSHELRSPLAAIHQFTTILLDGLAGTISGEQRECLEIVVKNSLQLRDMIDDLLEVTRAEGGKLTIEPRTIRLCDLFRSQIQTYERRAAAKGLAFPDTCSGCPENLPLVHADPNSLEQVLSNLLDNALKFTSHGEISVRCDNDDRDGFVRISVSDTGCGIDKASLPHIFLRLYQSPNTVESSRKGLGLGLHISKQLVELQGGRIWAESNVGQGTTVFFTVPVASEVGALAKR